MLLYGLLAAAVAATAASSRPLPGELRVYLAVAARYASGQRTAALREIREWPPSRVADAAAALRRQEKRLRSAVARPDEIDFRTVEAAVLLHAWAGLQSLRELRLAEARVHLDTSVELRLWAHRAAAEARNRATMRRHAFPDDPPDPALELQESIDGRELHMALAASALALGFPDTAAPFAEKARHDGPLDPEVQLVAGCAFASLAAEKALLHRDSEAARAREDAERAFRDALALDPASHEARLRLGGLLLDEGRAVEAEPLLSDVDARSGDDRRRYLARLLLGRVFERRARPEEAVRSYRRALEAWPDSQAARLGLAHALEGSSGPVAARELVAATLEASRRADRPADPWSLYLIGPPGLAHVAIERVWARTLGP
jgi:tetratricopeptide (TPR) repeat protein